MQLVYSKMTFSKAHVGLLLLCKQNSKLNSVFDHPGYLAMWQNLPLLLKRQTVP